VGGEWEVRRTEAHGSVVRRASSGFEDVVEQVEGEESGAHVAVPRQVYGCDGRTSATRASR